MPFFKSVYSTSLPPTCCGANQWQVKIAKGGQKLIEMAVCEGGIQFMHADDIVESVAIVILGKENLDVLLCNKFFLYKN